MDDGQYWKVLPRQLGGSLRTQTTIVFALRDTNCRYVWLSGMRTLHSTSTAKKHMPNYTSNAGLMFHYGRSSDRGETSRSLTTLNLDKERGYLRSSSSESVSEEEIESMVHLSLSLKTLVALHRIAGVLKSSGQRMIYTLTAISLLSLTAVGHRRPG